MGDKEVEKRPLRLAILGKPNVGKSSLVNALSGQKTQIVDAMPGTTHDAIPVIIETEEEPLIVVDTAGIRAAQKQDTKIEKMSVEQALYEPRVTVWWTSIGYAVLYSSAILVLAVLIFSRRNFK